MRRLMLLRHAKSDRAAGVDDHERPLNARGRATASRIGAYLAEHRLIPDLTVCSTSKRTQQTWHLLAPALPKSSRVVFDEALYLAEAEEILALVRAIPANVGCALLIGHNPGVHEAAIALAGSGDAALRRELNDKFPTAALAVLDLAGEDWPSVRSRSGRLERFVTPKSIGETD